ncbi:conjugative transfer protein MobI(A/C) [Alkalimarinus alittae]|uniref:Uncharacterized protein n=1 Tax=Alkalimarinus alittae TaxID=2961619 RepID=A0ABY6MX83_9ALTE|nr:conjugative transfer protein MobI(A/C) [Alkalimarinus alittae]UZE94402.1 hypothetical protein NKI27_09870 [Alkalimarinus alittae]
MKTNIDNILNVLAEESRQLEIVADSIADEFWGANKEHRSETNKWDRGSIGVRVRRLNRWLHVCWFKNKFYKREGVIKVFSEDLPRNKEVMRYRIGTLPSPTGWEKKAFTEAERQFESIRKAQVKLKEIDALMMSYLKDVKDFAGEKEMARVAKSIKEKNAAWAKTEIVPIRDTVKE